MKFEFCLAAAASLALVTACGNSPAESPTDATDTDSPATDTVSSFATDSTAGPGESDTQSTAPTTGMGNSGNSDPATSTDPDTTDTTPSTPPDTSDTVDSLDTSATTPPDTSVSDSDSDTSDSSSTGDSDDTTMGVLDTGDTSTTGDDTTTSDDTTTGPPPDPCGEPVLHATIRDFKFSHPDFEDYGGNTAFKGIVKPDLGPDMKPVYAHPGPTQQTTGPNEFKQWYNDTPNVNQAFMVDLPLTEIQPGLFQFADNTFFPIDNQGFGNEGQPNNFAFTTEIHTTFLYSGGETFTFTGDDDVWVFINNKLAIDLGGLHPQLTDMVNLDANAATLGIIKGNVYAMDLFHAERHTNESNFRIDTTIGCFTPQ